MRMYFGFREKEGCRVYWWETTDPARPDPLPMRLDLRNHSPDGPEWGYGGSGPAQLALALAAHASGDDALALAYYQHLKWKFTSAITTNCWAVSQVQIMLHLRTAQKVAPERYADQQLDQNILKAIQEDEKGETDGHTLIV